MAAAPDTRRTGPYRSGEEGSGETAPGPTRAGKRRRWHRPRPRPPRGTPEGAQDAVGGMGAAIVGTQRRAERTAATGGRRDHQSRFPPQRGSRAGRRADQCRAVLRRVGRHKHRVAQWHRSPSSPARPPRPRSGTGGAGGAELPVQRRRPSLGCEKHLPRLEDFSPSGFTSQRARVWDANI